MNAPLNHPLPLLDLDVLRTFVAIAETGSFTTAANAVFRTPSAVSMQIKKLEDILGRSVFSRDARSVSLTTDGEMLLGYARRMLAINREAVSKFIIPDIVGVVRLGSPDDYGERVLPHVLKRFAQSHPSIAVDVTIDQSINLRRRMDDRALDITLMTNSYKNSAPGAEVLLTEPIVWAGAKGGCAHMREPLPVSIWEEGCAWRAGALDALGREGRNYRVAYMSAHTAGQRAAIMADLAVAPLPKSFIGERYGRAWPEGRHARDRQLQPRDDRAAGCQRAGQGGGRPHPRDLRSVSRDGQVLMPCRSQADPEPSDCRVVVTDRLPAWTRLSTGQPMSAASLRQGVHLLERIEASAGTADADAELAESWQGSTLFIPVATLTMR